MIQPYISLTYEALNVTTILTHIQTHQAGAIDVFIGTVRNQTKGKEVTSLEFEAYKPMALKEMHNLAVQAFKQWNVLNIAIEHRLGKVNTGETVVIIAVNAAHRQATFECCRYLIDTLKKRVPIWKKEYFKDGNVWVSAHP